MDDNRFAAYRKRTELPSKPAFGQVKKFKRSLFGMNDFDLRHIFELINTFGGVDDYSP